MCACLMLLILQRIAPARTVRHVGSSVHMPDPLGADTERKNQTGGWILFAVLFAVLSPVAGPLIKETMICSFCGFGIG